MTIGELITRLQALPADALVVRLLGNTGQYTETGDRMDVIDVAQALDTRQDYIWWDCEEHERSTPELYRTREAVVL